MRSALNVSESRTSLVFSGEKVFGELNRFVQEYCTGPSPVLILADENTHRHCLKPLIDNVPCLRNAAVIVIRSGEEHKSNESVLMVWNEMNAANADRSSLMITLGGGVLTDLGGFAAATYKRGIPFIHVPTTLTGMVDAAIGGKTAINLNNLKNQVGVFALPDAVFIYLGFLKTLNPALVRDGMAEVAKYGLILDETLWKMVSAKSLDELMKVPLDDPFWEDIIMRSIYIKNDVVKEDYTEKGSRMILNFGHTFGHAFESLSLMDGTTCLQHGNAVAMGMICESYLSFRTSGLKEKDLKKITSWLMANFRYYMVPEKGFEMMREIFRQDKKRTGERINFTLLEKPGKAVTARHCDEGIIRDAFLYYEKLKP